ncbi:hypothetical protein AG1IA_00545 [Rhizoctonia solani AG-1 IA]|uniref:Uncharacterized protein n=1 Tax=Thanatephorus cucumeris (strain AG1-IA) TaxID=983506 RepID=L8X5C3_THACA|nr:hypothetical protein AG1IA_00545 [Rhizoctonia solani AG-1 IA]
MVFLATAKSHTSSLSKLHNLAAISGTLSVECKVSDMHISTAEAQPDIQILASRIYFGAAKPELIQPSHIPTVWAVCEQYSSSPQLRFTNSINLLGLYQHALFNCYHGFCTRTLGVKRSSFAYHHFEEQLRLVNTDSMIDYGPVLMQYSSGVLAYVLITTAALPIPEQHALTFQQSHQRVSLCQMAGMVVSVMLLLLDRVPTTAMGPSKSALAADRLLAHQRVALATSEPTWQAYRPGDTSGTCGGTGPVDQAVRACGSNDFTITYCP